MPTDGLEYTVNVHQDADGGYWAEVRELPGCSPSGRDLDALKEALVEAIQMCLPDEPNGRADARAVQISGFRMLVAAAS